MNFIEAPLLIRGNIKIYGTTKDLVLQVENGIVDNGLLLVDEMTRVDLIVWDTIGLDKMFYQPFDQLLSNNFSITLTLKSKFTIGRRIDLINIAVGANWVMYYENMNLFIQGNEPDRFFRNITIPIHLKYQRASQIKLIKSAIAGVKVFLDGVLIQTVPNATEAWMGKSKADKFNSFGRMNNFTSFSGYLRDIVFEWEDMSYECNGIMMNNPKVCSGNGVCYANSSCGCYFGYFGGNCEQYSCFGIDNLDSKACSNHGNCTSYDRCKCETGYFGASCTTYQCYGHIFNESNVCSGNGSCVSNDECACLDGHYGLECNNYNCFNFSFFDPKVCSGHGSCIYPDYCSCSTGYYGYNCSTFNCFDKPPYDISVCNGNGKCNSRMF